MPAHPAGLEAPRAVPSLIEKRYGPFLENSHEKQCSCQHRLGTNTNRPDRKEFMSPCCTKRTPMLSWKNSRSPEESVSGGIADSTKIVSQ